MAGGGGEVMEEVFGSCLWAEMGEETVEMGMVEGWGYP